MRVPLAWRLLWHQPLRALGAIGGIGMASCLAFFLVGLRQGVLGSAGAYVGQPTVDVWVARRGTENLIRSSSFLPADLPERLAADPDVVAASGILRAFARVESNSARATLLAIGYEPGRDLGAPPGVEAGRAEPCAGEIVLDRGAAHRLGVRPGDEVRVNGSPVRVAGLSTDTNILATQLFFGPRADIAKLTGAGESLSFVLVQLRERADVTRFAGRWMARDSTLAPYPRFMFRANSEAEVNAGFAPVFSLLSMMGAVITAAVVTLILYGRVVERRTQLALLAAIGASPTWLARLVFAQAALLGLAGVATGAALTLGFGAGTGHWAPEVAFALTSADLLGPASMVVVSSLLGALLPAAWMLRLDPEEVFRS